MTGGALPVDGGLIVVMTRFNRILEVDRDNLVARAETRSGYGSFSGRRGTGRPVLPPRPCQPGIFDPGRKRGGKRGRNPGGQIRRHPRLRSGIDGGDRHRLKSFTPACARPRGLSDTI